MSEYKDKTITCIDCGEEFVFTARDQEFYAEKGFNNEPKRCKSCRDKKKAERNAKFPNEAKKEEN
ncbi:MAG: cytochrome C551 [Bacilli bacterium]|nr:cytochrome C551 [Bacilli bacterium]